MVDGAGGEMVEGMGVFRRSPQMGGRFRAERFTVHGSRFRREGIRGQGSGVSETRERRGLASQNPAGAGKAQRAQRGMGACRLVLHGENHE